MRTHYEGKTPRAVLVDRAENGTQEEIRSAAADPKLPHAQRLRLIEPHPDRVPGLLTVALLENPSLTEAEIDHIVGYHESYLSGLVQGMHSWDTLRRVYEHPNTGRERMRHLLEEFPGVPTEYSRKIRTSETWKEGSIPTQAEFQLQLWEAAILRCASIHLSLTADDVSALTMRWHNAFWRLVEGPPANGGGRWEREQKTSMEIAIDLGVVAARLCTHPQMTHTAAEGMISLLRQCDVERIWEIALEEWTTLGHRDREKDWIVLTGGASAHASYEQVVLWAAVLDMAEEHEQPRDGAVIRRALESTSHPQADDRIQEVLTHVVEKLRKSRFLLDRAPWTVELARVCLMSATPAVREIGIYGLSLIQRQSAEPSSVGPHRMGNITR